MNCKKGIILAGGLGTRLDPITRLMSKQLLPIFDKPMIYYPLSVLMLGNIRDIMIISTPYDIHLYQKLFGDGSNLGIKISYTIQNKPKGIAECFLLCEEFIGNDSVCLILGDNFFYGQGLSEKLINASKRNIGATIFIYKVMNPNNFGVIKYDKTKKPIKIVEKPSKYISQDAVTGIYFFDSKVVDFSKQLKPSKRGELEIVDILNKYLKLKDIFIEVLGRGFSWLDTGTAENLLDTSYFVKTIQNRQNLKIACLEEISFKKKWINKKKIMNLIKQYPHSDYNEYLKNLVKDEYR